MKSFIMLVILTGSLTSCNESPEYLYKKNGMSVIIPSGWSVTEEENFDNTGYYLSIEKNALSSSGIISITWVNDSLDLDEYIEIFQDEHKNNIIYKYSNLIFETIQNKKFNKTLTRSSNYHVNLLGVRSKGVIYAFYGKDKTFAIVMQQTLEDSLKNKLGFHLIETSFTNE